MKKWTWLRVAGPTLVSEWILFLMLLAMVAYDGAELHLLLFMLGANCFISLLLIVALNILYGWMQAGSARELRSKDNLYHLAPRDSTPDVGAIRHDKRGK